jgi:transcriptional regulator with XRE-family HTH domain
MIGEKLKMLRELKNFTQEHLADKLSITQNSYSRLESGKTKLTLDYVDKLANIYEVDNKKLYEYLIEGDTLSVKKIINSQGIVALRAENFTLQNLNPDESTKIVEKVNEIEKTVQWIVDTLKLQKPFP